MRNRVILLTNIPTPYRIPLYNSIHNLLKKSRKFIVYYCKRREPNRHWQLDLSKHEAAFSFLSGFLIAFSNKELFFHFNPSVIVKMMDRRIKDVIICGSWNSPTTIFALLTIKLFNRSVRTIFWSENHKYAVRNTKGIISHLRKLFYKSVDAFIVPNELSEGYVRNIVIKPVDIYKIHNTINENIFNHYISKKNARRMLSLPDDKKIFITIAQLENRKGIPQLFRAIFPILIDNQNLFFIIVGSGSLKEHLIRMITEHKVDNVLYVERASQEMIHKYLNGADIFLLPSFYDPNPLSAIEAAYCGNYLVLSRFVGNATDLIYQTNGMILDAVDENEIYLAIIKILKQPDNILAVAAARTQQHVRKTFSLESNEQSIRKMLL